MAYTNILTLVALIAGVYSVGAQFPGFGTGAAAFAGAGAGAGGFAGGMFGPNFPFGPGGFPNLPQPPVLPLFGAVTFPPIKLPSPADIANMKPGPNSNVHGIMTVSGYSTQRGPNGELLSTGGTTVMANDNGDVKTVQFGDNPPTVNSNTQSVQSSWMPHTETPEKLEIKMPKFPKIKMPKFQKIKMPKFPKMKMPKFPDIDFPDIPDIVIPDIPDIEIPDIPDIEIPDIPDIEIPDIEQMKNYVPSEGAHFVSMSSISQSHSFDENGKKKNVGNVTIFINNNGKITSETIHFGDDGAKDKDVNDEKVEKESKEEENGKDGEKRTEGHEMKKSVQENEVDIDNENNNVKDKALGDMDKYEIV